MDALTPSLRFALVLRVEACLIPESAACAAQPVLRTGGSEGCKGCVSRSSTKESVWSRVFSFLYHLSTLILELSLSVCQPVLLSQGRKLETRVRLALPCHARLACGIFNRSMKLIDHCTANKKRGTAQKTGEKGAGWAMLVVLMPDVRWLTLKNGEDEDEEARKGEKQPKRVDVLR